MPLSDALAAAGSPSAAYDPYFDASGAKYGVNPALLREVARQESGFNSGASSPAGAVGLMQFMPGTAAGLGINPSDPAQAVDGAARLLSGYLKNYGGDVGKALAAYNAGPGAVAQYGGVPPFAETQNYVRTIMGRLGGASGTAAAAAAANPGGSSSDPGLTDWLTNPIGALTTWVGNRILDVLRPVAITGALLAAGAGLVIAGIWRSVTPQTRAAVKSGVKLAAVA